MADTPRDFHELVTWATWKVIEGIATGQPLRSVMHSVLYSALKIVEDWKNDD